MKPELIRALAVIAEPPGAAVDRVAAALELRGRPNAAEYTDLFALQLWPYASIYVGPEGKLGGEAADRVAGFWRALTLTPLPEPDHLAALLSMYASLTELEAAERDQARAFLVRRSRQAFLWEHLLSWMPVYLVKLEEIGSPFYRSWGQLLEEALISEAEELGQLDQLPLHLRDAPDFSGLDDIFIPVRSGMVLVRDDLARAARDLGLGLRQGERTYVLRALLDQDPGSTADWLRNEICRWIGLHRSLAELFGPVKKFWQRRAEISLEVLGVRTAV